MRGSAVIASSRGPVVLSSRRPESTRVGKNLPAKCEDDPQSVGGAVLWGGVSRRPASHDWERLRITGNDYVFCGYEQRASVILNSS